MSTQVEEGTSVADVVKLVFSSLSIVVGIVAFYYFAEYPLFYRVIGLFVIGFFAVAFSFNTGKGKSVWVFILESKQEFKRIVWPTRDEAIRTTLLVFVMVFLVGLILWLLDMFLFWGVQLLMSQGVK